ncbi:hypothetical protein COLO4_07780 [Corchorus olitorius]|uniref:K Homology domain-containing protein n=1 Tax=Corchorus olitorius TaxID=93759 RepID=A0A1R3KIU7_9ROSI|nr:hypothetical protein COLO4_07780 [Corchorus olitorius]
MTSSGGGGGRYMAYSPSPSAPHSPHLSGLRSAAAAASSAALLDQEKYLSELLAERHKLSPFMPVLPHTYRLLNQGSESHINLDSWSMSHWRVRHVLGSDRRKEVPSAVLKILRVTTLLGNASVLGQSGLEQASPLASGGIFSNGGADMNGWTSRLRCRFSYDRQSEANIKKNTMVQISGLVQPSSAQNWLSSQGSSSGLIVKRTIRVDIPVDNYPSYNFVGRLLGPRGNSLKRVEANTECRVLIRGRGSIKDPAREEMMRGKPGYEHLNEPLHILVEAELPVEIVDARLMQAREILEDLLKPVDESQDFYKKQQLRELAMLNGTLREEGSPMSGSVSPFHNSLGMKRAKTRGCCCFSQCLQLPSGHWHYYAPVLTCFYMKCVCHVFGRGLNASIMPVGKGSELSGFALLPLYCFFKLRQHGQGGSSPNLSRVF